MRLTAHSLLFFLKNKKNTASFMSLIACEKNEYVRVIVTIVVGETSVDVNMQMLLLLVLKSFC